MSISGVSSATDPQAAITAAAQPVATQQSTPKGVEAAPPPKDTVHLSPEAQAKALKQSGQTPVQIAQALDTDVKTVDGYLGIQAATTTTPAAAVPTETAKPHAAAPATKVETST